MLRSVGAVLAGYAAMAGVVMLTATLSWMILGASFAFQGQSLQVTVGWSVLSLVLGVLAALVGGWVCRVVQPASHRPVRALAALILILGLVSAVLHGIVDDPEGTAEPGERDPASLSYWEAASDAVQPAWYNYGLPFLGALGVLAGGRRRQRAESATA